MKDIGKIEHTLCPTNFFPYPMGFSRKLNKRQQTGPKCPTRTFRNLSQWRKKKTRIFSNAHVRTSKHKIFCIRIIPEMNMLSSVRGKLFLREKLHKKLKISTDSHTTTIRISVWDTIKVNTTKPYCRDVWKCGQDIRKFNSIQRTNVKHCKVTCV